MMITDEQANSVTYRIIWPVLLTIAGIGMAFSLAGTLFFLSYVIGTSF